MTDAEIWKAAPGLAGVEVSNLGRVRGHYRQRSTSKTYLINAAGYVSIYHRSKQYLVHRLVCEAFHGPAPIGKSLVLHRDDDKANNSATNLRWGDARENAADAKANNIIVGYPAHRTKRKARTPRERPVILRRPDDITHLLRPGLEG